jgi:hypothetical protein
MEKREKKNNSGGLFLNKDRRSETHAHMKGSVLIDGVEYWINAWKKVNDQNEVFFSLSFNPKNPAPLNNNPGSDNSNIGDFLNFLNEQ